MQLLTIASLIVSAISVLTASAHSIHADAPVQMSSGAYSIRPYQPDRDNAQLSQPFFSKHLGDSPFLNGRAALVPGYQTSAITFDYSGTEVYGLAVPPADSGPYSYLYSYGVSIKYPCLTEANKRLGNLIALYLDDNVLTTIDLGSYFAQQYCEQPVTITAAYGLQGNHTVRMVKITEPNSGSKVDDTHTNVTFISFNFVCDRPMQLQPLPAKKLRMEFLGDSITCGYHINCKAPMDPRVAPYTIESVLEAYPGKACANLDAQCHYISWSGRGMYLNVFTEEAKTVPYMYNYTMATVLDTEDRYDFSYFTPHIVVINLGTNDFHNPTMHDGNNTAKYVETYAATMWQIASNYGHTTVSIVTVCGPMSYEYCDYVQSAIKKVTTDHPTMRTPYFLQLDKLLNNDNVCADHPDAAVSILLANQLTDFVAKEVIPKIPGGL